jgi:hypothetical protein
MNFIQQNYALAEALAMLPGMSEYRFLAECIRAGRVNDSDAAAVFEEEPAFKVWYYANYG